MMNSAQERGRTGEGRESQGERKKRSKKLWQLQRKLGGENLTSHILPSITPHPRYLSFPTRFDDSSHDLSSNAGATGREMELFIGSRKVSIIYENGGRSEGSP
ncbi:unnamed protein product [Dovyalis caffra]|uniref:Uncharacterized protein n=1 Tax=Dovyalis caffra TaxID=77055 RepID=A0AAV1RMB6_9ROSI|nr:unnamed protein product [Dovyalis caffra]